ncbi:histone-lysine N-methyltransferase 2C-like [Nilaparvata lugens]|uniref:histone-lysine N-methyltransferase 2C-like n=1 Tax=Nilaparvata lugens TaxID=108931 RepID=UPI00193D52E4|nr:histone-lysine N-methyltransferase 2C-like [Nilaparvata lugens]
MLFCDLCDRGYHIYCVGLRKVPNGRWHCQVCSVCNSCGTTDPGGSDWQHEYKKEKNVKVYLQTLCGSCDRQWRKGYYCQICLRCYTKKPEEEQNLIKCTACDRWMHSECCKSAGGGIIMGNSVLCELCQERAMPKSVQKNRERLGSY